MMRTRVGTHNDGALAEKGCQPVECESAGQHVTGNAALAGQGGQMIRSAAVPMTTMSAPSLPRSNRMHSAHRSAGHSSAVWRAVQKNAATVAWLDNPRDRHAVPASAKSSS